MDMELALRTRLKAAAPVAASVADRIYWLDRPQGKALPDITLSIISAIRDQHMKGFQALQFTRVRADCRADTYLKASALSEDVIASMCQPAIVGGINFRWASVVGGRDLGENATGGFIHNKQIEFIIRYSPA